MQYESVFGEISRTKTPIILLILCYSAYLLLFFGTIDDFMFQHAGYAEKYALTGYIPNEEQLLGEYTLGLSGFYSFLIIICQVTGIEAGQIILMPVLTLVLIPVSYCLYLKFICDRLIASLLVLVSITYAWNSIFAFTPHNFGVLLLYLVIYSLLLFHDSNSSHSLNPALIIMSICVLIMGDISYKSSLWILCLLILTVAFSLFIMGNRLFDKKSVKLVFVTLIGLSTVLGLNKFFFDTFIPKLHVVQSLEYSSGIEKIFLLFGGQTNDPLSPYGLLYSSPKLVTYIQLTRLAIFGLINVVAMYYIFKNLWHNKKLHTCNDFCGVVLSSLVMVVVINTTIYSFIGLFDIGLLSLPGLLSIAYLYHNASHYKPIVILLLVFLLCLNISYDSIVIENDIPPRDGNYFSYISPSCYWYIDKVPATTELKTDVLTWGYYISERIYHEPERAPSHFSTSDILMLTSKDTSKMKSGDLLYLINYDLRRFSITNWRMVESFASYRQIITSNDNINQIYQSSDLISIFYTESA
ncbi:conserved membrane protein of unknown function [Methanoculleus bourgensis]|nr:conserved membrane protein of unknown function [Methanoculleus bourgensis]